MAPISTMTVGTVGSSLADVSKGGAFVRKAAVYRDWIKAGTQFPPEKGRYVLYVSYACPWASRCLAYRALKGLEKTVELCVVSPVWNETKKEVDNHTGWMFDSKYDGDCTVDPIFGQKSVRGIYDAVMDASGEKLETRFTVPLLVDKVQKKIVNNESSEIIRMFNENFNEWAEHPDVDMSPESLRSAIDEMNESTYESVCNGVYKCGFARTQEAYDAAVVPLFKRLDELDLLLSTQRFLIPGGKPTESDVRLFVCLIRFDEVYAVHFKCSKRRIREYPSLSKWLADVYHTLQLATTVNMKHIREHYYMCHESINPFRVVAASCGAIEELGTEAPASRKSLK
eukprot:GHVN01026997.1.p1 GENE.GHVN01026997.1~~GHVN01026997.1.p1  ORF type:complete len:341 (+),score=40.81 GHVN01026997.1:207-1229(+)